MNKAIVHAQGEVLLIGGSETDVDAINVSRLTAEAVVAADGGLRAALGSGVLVDAVIGDMDSVSQADLAQVPEARRHHIAEQDSTDFDKALRHIEAPLIVGHGFLGRRVDHQLAVFSTLAARADRRCLLVGRHDLVVICPPQITLSLAAGTRVSLWPLGPVNGTSTGLRWPIDGIDFAPAGRVGTSNEALGEVTLSVSAPLMLLILPPEALGALKDGLSRAPSRWPARA